MTHPLRLHLQLKARMLMVRAEALEHDHEGRVVDEWRVLSGILTRGESSGWVALRTAEPVKRGSGEAGGSVSSEATEPV